MDRARGEIAKAVRYASPLSLMVIDADDFKRVNDQYGHPTGHDILARYGGEEFVVLLSSTMGPSLLCVAEKLRAAVEAAQIIAESKPAVRLSVTVSIGLSSLRDGEHDLNALFARADAALYQSKRNGKNRWTEQ